MARSDAVVEPDWLEAHLSDPHVRVVDGSWLMPSDPRSARADFETAHIPGAVFFDIDEIADATSPLPHMLPSQEAFAKEVGALGIGTDDRVVVYDGAGLFSAARVWWTFRAFGHDNVVVLDGGFPRWRAERRPIASGPAAPTPRTFEAKLQPALIRDLEQMRVAKAQVVDARGRDRFLGTTPEPRPNLRGGHMPGSRNLPFGELIVDGRLRPDAELRSAFQAAGLDLERPIITTCGSGITAAVLALALFVAGHSAAAVYDGSWTEWGGRDDTPVATGSD